MADHNGYIFKFSEGLVNVYECEQCGALIPGPTESLDRHSHFHSMLNVLLNSTVAV